MRRLAAPPALGAVLASGLAVLTSCLDAVAIEAPPVDAVARIFIVFDEGRAPRAFAQDASTNLALALPPHTRVVALSYTCDLPSLGLGAGELTLALDDAPGRPWPVPSATHVASLDDGLTWRSDVVPAALDAVRIAVSAPPCFELDSTTEIVARDTTFAASLLVDPTTDTALLARSDGSFLRVTSAGAEALDPPVDGPIDGAFFDHAGELWILGPGARTRHGARAGPFVDGPERPNPATCGPPALQLVTSPPGAPFEVFVLTCGGALQRFDGARWTVVATGLVWDATSRLAWLDEGVVLFGEDSATTVSRFTLDGARTEEPLGIESPFRVASAASPEGFGPVAGTSDGVLHTRGDQGVWRPLTATFGREPRVAVALPTSPEEPRTLFFGGVRNEFWQWVEGWGRCETAVSGAGNARLGAATREHALAVSTDTGRTILSRFTITARPPPLRCPVPR